MIAALEREVVVRRPGQRRVKHLARQPAVRKSAVASQLCGILSMLPEKLEFASQLLVRYVSQVLS